MKNYKTLLLNANGKPIKIISWKKSVVLVYEKKAIELDFYQGVSIRDGKGRRYTIPAVIMLKDYVVKGYNYAKFTKANVIIRDSWTCSYCGVYITGRITLDHIIPKALGGKSNWYNLTTACLPCNKRKGDFRCEEISMYPLCKPARPAYSDLYIGINPFRDTIPVEWIPYIPNIMRVKQDVKKSSQPEEEPIHL